MSFPFHVLRIKTEIEQVVLRLSSLLGKSPDSFHDTMSVFFRSLVSAGKVQSVTGHVTEMGKIQIEAWSVDGHNISCTILAPMCLKPYAWSVAKDESAVNTVYVDELAFIPPTPATPKEDNFFNPPADPLSTYDKVMEHLLSR